MTSPTRGRESRFGTFQTKPILLRDIIEKVSAGVSVNGEDRPCKPGELGVLKLSAIAGGHFCAAEHKAIREDECQRAARPVRKGSLLMSRSNTLDLVGTVAYVDADCPNMYLPDLIWEITLKPESDCNPQWLGALLQTTPLRQQIQSRASGTSGSMKKLSTHSLLSMSIVLPCRTEQDKAVELMNSNAGVLDQTKALLDLKARFRKEIAYRLLCGTTRHPYSLGARWVNVSLGELFVERNETQRADLPLLSITADRGVIRRSEVDRKDSSSENKTAYKRITPGDIGYNTMRMWQGVSALSEQEGIISPAYTVCTPTNHVDGRFAAHLFKHPSMINLFFRHSQGLVDDTLNLKFSHFAKIRVTIPEIDEQRHIAHILDSLNDELHALRKYHALLHVKAELLRERLTGAALIIAGDRVG